MSQPHVDRQLLRFVFVSAALNSVGFGIIIPVLPDLLREVTGATIGEAAAWGGWLLFVYALMQFAFGPLVGNLSDRFGRRPVLLTSIAALTCDYLLMGWAPTIGWIFLGRLIAGACAATVSTINAYVADISPARERPANMALIGAAWGVGFILGPAIGGLLGEFGTRVPFYGAAILGGVGFLWGLLVLPESLTPENRRPFELGRAHLMAAFGQMRRYPMVMGLIGASFLYYLGHQVYPAIWSFYVIEKFAWSPGDIGISLAFMGAVQIAVSVWLIRAVIHWSSPRTTASLGLVFQVVAYVGFALASSGLMIYAFLLFGALGGFASALNGITSNQVPANAQGELQGAIGSVISFSSIIGPLFMTQLFAFFAGDHALVYLPGAPFLTSAALTLAALAVFLRASRAPNARLPRKS